MKAKRLHGNTHTYSVELGVKVERPHLTKGDYHEWVFLGDREWRDKLGRHHRHPTMIWLVGICNNTTCTGRVLIDSWALARALADAGVSDE